MAKFVTCALVAVALSTPAFAQPGGNKPEGEAAMSKAEQDKIFYALGAMMGGRLKSDFDLSKAELEQVKKGLTDAVEGKKLQVNVEEMQPKLGQLARERSSAKAEGEKKKGEQWAEKTAKEKGATKTESGLVYRPIKEGTGAQPAATDTVKVHYRGTLTDGTEFDSSYKRNEPATFPLNQVIPCWTEGVAKMKVGGKAQLVCPSKIAYGDMGRPPTIPGGATLVFEVELL
ncbi:MAG: FKBP-type peptidyl-prolyl cis-trans isomerase, partial [Myxococcales bacterium]